MSKEISETWKGEVGVHWAIAELLKEGCDIYVPVVDDRGIDLILRREINGKVSFLELQFRKRSGKDCGIPVKELKSNYWYVLFSFTEERDKKDYWVIPSEKMPEPQDGKFFMCGKWGNTEILEKYQAEPYKGLDSLIKWSRGEYVKFD